MTGLRQWKRDPDLPGRAGEPELAPLDEAALLDLVEEHLLLPDGPAPRSVTWEYARWKPGVSITCAYRLGLEDGSEELCVAKRYAGDKARTLAERDLTPARPFEDQPALRARAVLPERSLALWTPSADRELGLRFLLDHKRFPKLLRDSGLVEPGLVRRRKTAFHLLRYKPERRAVYRVDLRLRDEARTRFSLAVRVLPPEGVEALVARRTALEAGGGAEATVPLACAHARHGLVVEPWLAVETGEPDDFAGAEEAGRALARLHALATAEVAVGAKPAESAGALAPLFAEDATLVDGLERLSWPEPVAATTWVHGDFHPDQVARDSAGTRLLDLDCLRVGDPLEDLASWVADHLHGDPQASWEAATATLLEGYAEGGGAAPEDARLRRAVAHLLAHRAAASLRRLEEGALERARQSLRRARELGA